MLDIFKLSFFLLVLQVLASIPAIDARRRAASRSTARSRWSFMKLHAQLNLTKHEDLDTPLIELIPELAEVTPEAIQDCHESIHSPNSSHSALFVPGALLRDVLHEFYSFYDDKSITNRQITRVIEILKVIVEHVLECNPHLQKRDINYRKPQWKAGLNAVADREMHHLVDLNWTEKMGQLHVDPVYGNCDGHLTPVSELPATFDMREKSPNVVGHIRDQKECGSCWSMSTTGSAEAAMIQAGHTDIPLLSPQFAVDFDKTNMACQGGIGHLSFPWAVENGFVREENYPYANRKQRKKRPKTEYTVSGFCFRYDDLSFDERRQMIHTHGAIWVAMSIHKTFITYKSGLYDNKKCNRMRAAHALTVVGYGEGYLLIRNSWGSEWGEGGMVKIDPMICQAQFQAGYMIAS